MEIIGSPITKRMHTTIGGREVSMNTILKYARACKYNADTGTAASDRMQHVMYHKVLGEACIHPAGITHADRAFMAMLAVHISELLYYDE